jgi:hypothetical protein
VIAELTVGAGRFDAPKRQPWMAPVQLFPAGTGLDQVGECRFGPPLYQPQAAAGLKGHRPPHLSGGRRWDLRSSQRKFGFLGITLSNEGIE